MKPLVPLLQKRFSEAIKKAFPNLQDCIAEVVPTTHERFGHYQFNSAMKLAKELHQPPRSIAEKIASQLQTDDGERPFIAHVEIAGPGFINVTIATEYLAFVLQKLVGDARLGIEPPIKKLKIIIDFSSPNTAKEMHVGHLRSTIIGDALARLFEFAGHDVLRLNHIGDWGTSFGMLIAFMKQQAPQVLEGKKKTDLTHLVHWYREAKNLFDRDPTFKKESQRQVVMLQQGDGAALKAWQIICEISRQAYQEIYDLLDVKLVERGESFYNPLLAPTIADLENKGLVQLSDGAKCIFLDGFQNREGAPLPLMVQKSDGGYNYDTTDMAAIKHRLEVEKGDRLIYVTDAGQATHFEMVFKAAEKAGYLNRESVRVDHVPFGLVLGIDGKKFRTRAGDSEKLIDLLNSAVKRAGKIVRERNPEMSGEEVEKLAKALGVGAVKYADLSCHRTGNYTFSYERMLRFEGNTAAFMMYAYVRVAGIKRRVNVKNEQLQAATIRLEHPTEITLALHLLQFGEALQLVENELLPNRLTDYLYLLAEKFHAFFRDCHVEGSDQQNSRLLLCDIVARTLDCGLQILGLQTVDRM